MAAMEGEKPMMSSPTSNSIRIIFFKRRSERADTDGIMVRHSVAGGPARLINYSHSARREAEALSLDSIDGDEIESGRRLKTKW
jgi:hypothetical protein